MKIQIDLKSALLGIGIGVFAMFTIGAGTSSDGKYQITGIGNGTGGWAVVMVDTETGKAWGADMKNDFKGGGFWEPK